MENGTKIQIRIQRIQRVNLRPRSPQWNQSVLAPVAGLVQVAESYDPNNLVTDLVSAAKEHNNNTKKKANFANTWIQLFEKIKRPFVKAKGVAIKTKSAVRVVFLENEDVKV